MKKLIRYLCFSLIPTALFTILLLFVHAQPYDDHELREFLLPDGCSTPCFMSIRPGVTTVDEVLKLLNGNQWVKEINNNTLGNLGGSIIWTWSDQKPDWISQNVQGEIYVENGLVFLMTIYSDIPLGETRLILGLPDTEIIDAKADQSREYALYSANYNQMGFTIRSWQPCHVIEPLRNTVSITMSEPFNNTVKHINSLNDVFNAC